MNKKKWLAKICLGVSVLGSAQQTTIWQDKGVSIVDATVKYKDNSYMHAQHIFSKVVDQEMPEQEKAAFFKALSSVMLEKKGAEDQLINFVNDYPGSIYTQTAFVNMGNHFYEIGDYKEAYNWYKRVNPNKINENLVQNYFFRTAYSSFVSEDYTLSKKLFQQVLNSKYKVDATYYLGHIAYIEKNYTEAFRYLDTIREDKHFKTQVLIYLTQINFYNNNYKEAIEDGIVILPKIKSSRQRGEINKIIGESYFQLKDYKKAKEYLDVAAKKLKLTNTDYYQLGFLSQKNNKTEEAIQYYNKITSEKSALGQNAYYELAKLYASSDKKNEALHAYSKVLKMDYDKEIQANAHLNYAKLSYDIGNPYESVSDVLKNYLKAYPNSAEKSEITKMMIRSYITSKQYEGAIQEMKNLDLNTLELKEIHQKVYYFNGLDKYNQANYNQAIENFDVAISQSVSKKYQAKAYFWKAETLSKLNKYDQALESYLAFNAIDTGDKILEQENYYYHLGYTYFYQKNYQQAIPVLEGYLKNEKDKTYKDDALLRLADAYFSTKDYQNALAKYQQYVSLNPTNSAYAAYQSAESAGLLGDLTKKKKILTQIIEKQSSSAYVDNAMFSLASSYQKEKKYDQAITFYSKLESKYKKSSLVPEAVFRRGMVYFNQDKESKALKDFQTVAEKYPESTLAIQALNNAKFIMIENGDVNNFEKWVSKLSYVNLSDLELEKTVFENAQKQVHLSNYSSAIRNFTNYKQKYPNGAYYMQAVYLLAESYYQTNDFKNASQNFEEVRNKSTSMEQYEQSLLRLGQIYLGEKDLRYVQVLEELRKESSNTDYLFFAQYELMKHYSKEQKHGLAVNLANLLNKNPKADTYAKEDANLVIARSEFSKKEFTSAAAKFKRLEKAKKSSIKAEALYFKALFLNKNQKYDSSNDVVFQVIEEYANENYWGAKVSLLMADNFYKLKDPFQAQTILEMVLETFGHYPDIVEEANLKLKEYKSK